MILFFVKIYGFSQEPYYKSFSTSDGLPSNEIYCINQDSDGLIWIGTDQGVSSYDGKYFTNYDQRHGLKKLQINKIIKDSHGVLWFSSYYGGVFKFENGIFKPYRYNSLIFSNKKYTNLVDLEYIDNEGNFYFNLPKQGILKINSKGDAKVFTIDCPSCLQILKLKDGNLLFNLTNSKSYKFPVNERDLTSYDIILVDEKNKFLGKYRSGEKSQKTTKIACNESNDLCYFSFKRTLYKKDSSGIKPVRRFNQYIIFLKITDENKLIIGLDQGGGLVNMDMGATEIISNWFKGKDISHVFKDNKEGMWVSSIDQGLFFIPNKKTQCYTFTNTKEANIISLLPITKGSVYAGTFSKKVWFLDKYKIKKTFYSNYQYINDIVLINYVLCFRNTKIELPYKKEYNNLFPVIFEKKHKSDMLYGADKNYLYYYENSKWKMLDVKEPYQINDLFRPGNEPLWIATSDGLFTFDNNKYLNIIPELKNKQIQSLDQLKDGTIIVGTLGYGLYFIRNKKIIKQITSQDGLKTDNIQYVWVDNNDQIWMATFLGLHKIIVKGNKINIRFYDQKHGIPSNIINMVRTKGDDVWLATDKGLVAFHEQEPDSFSYNPIVRTVHVNGKLSLVQKLNRLPYDQNNIKLTFHNKDYSSLGAIPYRFRLSKHHSWTTIDDNTIQLYQLDSKKYNIEIQAANKDGIWSQSTILYIYIMNPWWQTWWFYALTIFSISGIVIHYFSLKKKAEINELSIKKKILELERKALQAQMNPHFIFNAFSAIQYYINKNERKLADDYLTDLSKLIRKILDNSFKHEIKLSEELSLLKLYIELEQRKVDNQFTYNIIIEPYIEAEYIKIPPMLVQPLVENAINHGILPLKGIKGHLFISIYEAQNKLHIDIADNGIGFDPSKENNHHKSYGLQLINDRIDVHNSAGQSKITLINYPNKIDGKHQGTVFALTISGIVEID